MNFLEVVKSRYSVRDFLEREVESDKLEYIIECARLAPSACNRQPWQIHIVKRGEKFDALCASAERFRWMKSAPMIIAVTVDDDAAWHRGADNHNHSDIDAAIICEHIVLAAAEQSLGTCWICAFNPEKADLALGLKSPQRTVALLPLGYPNCEQSIRVRKSREEIVIQE
jgi:nitroreductase